MNKFLVLHRDKQGHYTVYSSYKTTEEIAPDMYHAFQEAGLGEEYIVIDTEHHGNGVVCVYKLERRVICRTHCALETAWTKEETPKAHPIDIGDGAQLIRFV